MAAALKYLGYSANDTDEAHWRRARDLIIRAKPYWAAFNASSYIKELTVGNIWLAHGYSSDMFQAQQDAQKAGRPFSIGYATPKRRRGAGARFDGAAQERPAPRSRPPLHQLHAGRQQLGRAHQPDRLRQPQPARPAVHRTRPSPPTPRSSRTPTSGDAWKCCAIWIATSAACCRACGRRSS